MTPKDYRLITSLMLASLITIVSVQGYSLWDNYRQVKGEFERDVRQAITDFNYTLETSGAYLSTLGDSSSYDFSQVNEDSSVMLVFSIQAMNTPKQEELQIPDELRMQRTQDAQAFFSQLSQHPTADTNFQEVIVVKNLIVCQDCNESYRLDDYYPLQEMLGEELTRQGLSLPFEMGIYALVGDSIGWNSYTSDTATLKQALYQQPIFRNAYQLYVVFPSEGQYLMSRLTWSALWSVLLVGLIFGSFWFALRIIQRQKHLAELKNDFINNMTHEFKTPIATIAFAAANIEHEHVLANPDLVRNFTKVIREENQRMNGRVEQVLKAAVAERKAFALEQELVNVHELIARLSEPLRMQVDAEGGTLTLSLHASPSTVIGDDLHLGNVLSNLLDNARKYSPQSPQITIKTETTAKGLWIRVSDQGIGMSKEAQRRVFEQFYRVPTGNLHNIKGFGLGLAYAHAVVEQHGGHIEVDSKLNQGSTFSVFLPHQPQTDHDA